VRTVHPHADQLAFLSSLRPASIDAVTRIVEDAQRRGQILGVRMAVTDGDDDEPWTAPPSRRRAQRPITGTAARECRRRPGQPAVRRQGGLPPPLINQLIRTAAFQNPEFYKAQAMRLSTFGKPRVVSCAEDFTHHVGLPRGCLDDVADLLEALGMRVRLKDERHSGSPIDVRFDGLLRSDQEEAFRRLSAHDTGVLAATTAFGKTVVAARLIASRAVSTLVLVHRQQLLDQWIERLSQFLRWSPQASAR